MEPECKDPQPDETDSSAPGNRFGNQRPAEAETTKTDAGEATADLRLSVPRGPKLNSMTVELTLAIVIPLAFWLFDILAKVLGALSTEDVGADLCLVGVSFNATTLLTSLFYSGSLTEVDAKRLTAIYSATLILSLVLYVFSLILIAPSTGRSYPALFNWLRGKSWKVTLTVILGFTALSVEIGIFVNYFKQ